MPEKLSHEEYVKRQRTELVRVAKGILNGTIPILEGARAISSLGGEVGLPEDDEDLMTFVLIDSDTDHLPVGDTRQHWAADALAEKDQEIESAESWYHQMAIDSCRRLLFRLEGAA
jgi:hypothetical protein